MEQKVKVLLYGKRAKRPIQMSYRSELNVSQALNPKEAHEYQQFVRIDRWIVELGRAYILYEVSLLSSHLVMPRKVHMETMMVIFVYIEKAYRKTVIIDTMIPLVDTSVEIETNWLKSIYSEDNQDEITADTPETLGNIMSVRFFVDASRVG